MRRSRLSNRRAEKGLTAKRAISAPLRLCVLQNCVLFRVSAPPREIDHGATSATGATWAKRVKGTPAKAPRKASLTTGQCGRTAQAVSSVQS
jgi:hypothetical protein